VSELACRVHQGRRTWSASEVRWLSWRWYDDRGICGFEMGDRDGGAKRLKNYDHCQWVQFLVCVQMIVKPMLYLHKISPHLML
jgi:hypothetical protein